jgi:hypothetical protein
MHKVLGSIPSTKKKRKKEFQAWAWWYMSIKPTLGRERQKDFKFKVSLGYIWRSCLK